MFLVVVEYTERTGKEWSVVAHGPAGLGTFFPTREAAEKVAMEWANERTNRFAVVQIKSWFQQEVQRKVVKTRID